MLSKSFKLCVYCEDEEGKEEEGAVRNQRDRRREEGRRQRRGWRE